MPEWKPGVLAGLLREIETTGQAHLREGMLKIAAAVEAKAKAELSETSHRYGTPTPAGRGAPPALVTGTGRRSIGHQYLPGTVPDVKIGTLAGVYPPKEKSTTGRGTRSRAKSGTTGSRGSTPSSKYLMYQETLERFNHPFLVPAFRHVVAEDAVRIWLASFRIWPRL